MGEILAIDPGSERSAMVVTDGQDVKFWYEKNAALRHILRAWKSHSPPLAIEYMYRRGMPLMQQAIDTMFEAGRFVEARGGEWTPIDRADVKLHICGNPRAKDSNIRQALIDRWGGREKAVGAVKCPACKGKGWRGRGRPTCESCHLAQMKDGDLVGSGYLHPPGPLHGITGDVWSALAVAVTYLDAQATSDAT